MSHASSKRATMYFRGPLFFASFFSREKKEGFYQCTMAAHWTAAS